MSNGHESADWSAVTDLFHAALAREVGARSAFLAEACAGNDALCRQVERLIRAHEAGGHPIDQPLAARAFEVLADEPALPPNTIIGRYRLVRELGRGGMGAVYLAQRADDEFQQQVAVKLIKRGMDTDTVVRHFHDERQIMAALEHANIARLLDGGTTADGLPYFVMEYVEGQRIDRYCEDLGLDIDNRLALFEHVCAAVSYAHQRLVVHRDIKPSNILVTAAGVPKLLDFGIAKVMSGANPAETAATSLALRLMTPQYASPEQMQGLRVDTLSDVYSLGVLLFELLTGRLPHPLVDQRGDEAVRIVATTDAPRPSTVVAHRLQRRLRGDLDTIVTTALAKTRERRYQSVDHLVDDIRRHLDGRPIRARHDAFLYRAVKLIKRNRLPVGAAAIIAATLLWGMVSTTRQAIRADREAAVAQAVTDFLQNDLLGQANSSEQAGPAIKADPQLTVRAALDRAAARIDGRFDADPAVQAAIRQTIGDAYHGLTLYAPAQKQMERALELRRTALGTNHADTLRTMTRLGTNYNTQGAPLKAIAILTDAVAGWRRLHGENHADTLAAMADLALAVRGTGDVKRAVELYSDVLRVQQRLLGEEHPDTLAVMNNLAAMYTDQGRFAESEALLTKTIALRRRILGEEHPRTLTSMNGLGITYRTQGKYALAAPLLRAVLDARARVLGPDHRETLSSRHSLARVYEAEGRYELSHPLLLQNLEARRRTLGAEHFETMSSLSALAESYRKQGRYDEAEPLFDQLLEVRRRTLTQDNPTTLATLTSFAALKRAQRQYAAAEQYLREALRGYDRIHSETWQRYYAEAMLGATFIDLRRPEQAQPILAAAYRKLTERRSFIPVEDLPLLDAVKEWAGQ